MKGTHVHELGAFPYHLQVSRQLRVLDITPADAYLWDIMKVSMYSDSVLYDNFHLKDSIRYVITVKTMHLYLWNV
jgi:hypothetical protein